MPGAVAAAGRYTATVAADVRLSRCRPAVIVAHRRPADPAPPFAPAVSPTDHFPGTFPSFVLAASPHDILR